jgi:general secretion pathway protein L
MAALQIYLRENSADDTADWLLREPRGRIISAGNARFADMPPADQVNVVVPASRVLFTRINLPVASAAKIRKLLPFAVEDKLLSNPETIHAVAGTRGLNGETPVAVVDKGWVNELMARLLQAKIQPHSLVPETTLPPLPERGWCMVWDGARGFVRTGAMDGMSFDGGDANTPPLELLLALDEARAKNAAPEKIILLASDSSVHPDFVRWHEQLGVPFELGGIWDNAHAHPQASQFNFLQGDYAPSHKMDDALARAKPIWIIAGIIAALHIGATMVDWALLKNQKSALQSQMTERFKKVFPDAKVIVDAPLQMSRNLAELRRAGGVADASDFLPLLGVLSNAVSATPNARTTGLQYDKGRLLADVSAPNNEALESLRKRLQDAKLSAKVESSQPKADGVEARLSISGGNR